MITIKKEKKLLKWLLKNKYYNLLSVFDIFFKYQNNGYIDIFLGSDPEDISTPEHSLVIINNDDYCFHFYLIDGIYDLYINNTGEIYKVYNTDFSFSVDNYSLLSYLDLMINNRTLYKEIKYQNTDYIHLALTEINDLINLELKKYSKYEFNLNDEKIFIKISKIINYTTASSTSIYSLSDLKPSYRIMFFNDKTKTYVTLLIDKNYSIDFAIIDAYAKKYVKNPNTGFHEFENISKDVNEVFDILQNQVAFQISEK